MRGLTTTMAEESKKLPTAETKSSPKMPVQVPMSGKFPSAPVESVTKGNDRDPIKAGHTAKAPSPRS